MSEGRLCSCGVSKAGVVTEHPYANVIERIEHLAYPEDCRVIAPLEREAGR